MDATSFLSRKCDYSSVVNINLYNNSIKKVSNINFRYLTNLTYIYLNLNHIRTVNRALFSKNKKLKYINLSYNRIANFFLNIDLLPSLQYLDLGYNHMARLNQSIFENYVKQDKNNENKTLVLSKNLFQCPCSMLWLSYVEEVDIIDIIHLHTDVCVTCLLNMSCKEVVNFKSKEECDLGEIILINEYSYIYIYIITFLYFI